MKISNVGIGYGAAIAASVFTAAMFAIGKWVVTGVSPIPLLALMFSVVTVFMALWMTISRRWTEFLHCRLIGWIYITFFSIFSCAAIYAMWVSLVHLDPTVASFISRFEVLVAIMLGMTFLRERFRLMEGIGGVIVLCGLIVLRITFDVQLSFWFWIMILSAVLFGATEFTAKLEVRYLAPIPLTFIRSLAVTLFFVVLCWVDGVSMFHVGKYWWAIVALGITGPALGRIAYLTSLKHINISKAALITQSKPLFVALIAYCALGMIPTPREWIGGVLILAGCVLIIIPPQNNAVESSKT